MGVGLVSDDAVRAAPRLSAGPSSGHSDVIDQRQELRIVAGLARGEPHRKWPSPTVDAEVGFGAPPSAGATQRMVLGLRPPKPVIRPCPLCAPGAPQRRAGELWPRWSRSRPPTPGPRLRERGPAARAAPDPRCRPWPTGRNATRPSARQGNRWAGPATAIRSGTASRSPRGPDDDHSTAHRAAACDREVAVRSEPTSHLTTTRCAT